MSTSLFEYCLLCTKVGTYLRNSVGTGNKIRYNAKRALLWQTSIPGRGLSVAHLTAVVDPTKNAPIINYQYLWINAYLRASMCLSRILIFVYTTFCISIFILGRCPLRGKKCQHMRRRALVLSFYSNEFSGYLHVLKINICGVQRWAVIIEAFHGGT